MFDGAGRVSIRQVADEMKASITLDKYKDWSQYEKWRALNIEGMHRHVSLHRRGN